MVPYVRLQAHFMKEKSHFPYIPESGELNLDGGIAAFPPPETSLLPGPTSAASQPWPLHNILFCCLFKRSPWDCLYLLFSIMKIVSLAWGKHKVEMLKIYCSGLLLKRDFTVWGQSLLRVCLLLVLGFAMHEYFQHLLQSLQDLSVCWASVWNPVQLLQTFQNTVSACVCDSLSPCSHPKFALFLRQVKHLLLNAEQRMIMCGFVF